MIFREVSDRRSSSAMAAAASAAPAPWLTVLKSSSPAVRCGGSFRAWTLALRIARALARYISFVIGIASIVVLLCRTATAGKII